MKSRSGLFILSVLIAMLVLAACGGAAPAATEAPLDFFEMPVGTAAPAMPEPSFEEQSAVQEDEAMPQEPAAGHPSPPARGRGRAKPPGRRRRADRYRRGHR